MIYACSIKILRLCLSSSIVLFSLSQIFVCLKQGALLIKSRKTRLLKLMLSFQQFIMIQSPSEKEPIGDSDSSSKAGKIIKVHYLEFRGTCQPIINLLYYLKIKFQMVYQLKTAENISDVGFNTGIPYIENKEVRVHETIAIMHYLCTKSDKAKMTGLTPQQSARKQELLMKYFAQRKKINVAILQAICFLPTKPDKHLFVEIFLKKLCTQCKYVDYCLKKLASGNNFIWDQISIVDFLFYEIAFYVCGFFGRYIHENSIYRYFKKFKERFQKLTFFEKNKNQIEKVPLFMAFNDEAVNSAIQEMWEGGPYKLLNRN